MHPVFFAWTYTITRYTSKSADQIFINVYISSKLQILSVMIVHITFETFPRTYVYSRTKITLY